MAAPAYPFPGDLFIAIAIRLRGEADMVFGRWKKSVRDTAAKGEIDGVIRRGLAETTGRLPSERIATRPRVEGRNPYNQTSRQIRKSPAVASPGRASDTSAYDGPGNPYNTAAEVPEKKKPSWKDVPIDTRDRD